MKPRWNKWSIVKILTEVPELKAYLPTTSLYNGYELKKYLLSYPSIYIKPVSGSMGLGVIKVWRKDQGYALVREKGEPAIFPTLPELEAYLNAILGSKHHVIQMAISLAEIEGNPYDIRLLMMKDRKNKWANMGMFAKVAGTNSVVTNVARGGGYTMEVEEAIIKSLRINKQKAEKIIQEMIDFGYRCSDILEDYCDEWQIGYDLALDLNQKIWFLEANTRYMSHVVFKVLKDKTIYQEIRQLADYHRSKLKQ